jgi:hypothetical protein
VSHEDVGMNLILEAIDKSFLEKSIGHALHVESQAVKINHKVFHYAILFQLGQTT